MFKDESEIISGSPYDLFMRNLLGYMSDGSSEHDDAPDSLAGLCAFIEGYLRQFRCSQVRAKSEERSKKKRRKRRK